MALGNEKQDSREKTVTAGSGENSMWEGDEGIDRGRFGQRRREVKENREDSEGEKFKKIGSS